MTAIPLINALFETSLASAMTAAASSFTIVSGTDGDGNALSGTYGFIIDEGTADEEFVVASISGTTGTVTYRGCDRNTPTTEVTANKKPHRRGASVKITDYPILGYVRSLLNGDYTFPNKLAYESAPTFVYGNKEFVTYDKMKDYADSLANTGAADATTTVQGLVEEPTQAEIEAGTDAGGTGAKLFVPASKHGGKLYFGYAADAGANDTYAITCSPVPTAYTAGMVILFKANTANTGACTLNVNSLGAKSLKVNKDLDPQDGYIKAGQIVHAVYDGTNFQILSISGKPSVSQTGEELYGASSGASDTYAITLSPAPTAYTTGMTVRFKADVANTGACTLNVNSLGAKTIKKWTSGGKSDLTTGDIQASQFVEVIYDGTDLLMLSAQQPRPLYATGQTTQTADTTGTKNIAHGLGVIPRLIKITAMKETTATNPTASICVGTATGTSDETCTSKRDAGSSLEIYQDSSSIINMQQADAAANCVATVSALDETNITLNFTTNAYGGTVYIQWEAYA